MRARIDRERRSGLGQISDFSKNSCGKTTKQWRCERRALEHAQGPAYCNNPKPGFEEGFCSTYNPADRVSEGSTLILIAVLDSRKYTLSCARCGMLETGEYPARRSGPDFVIFAHKLDKHGNKTGKAIELKLRIIGEESQ